MSLYSRPFDQRVRSDPRFERGTEYSSWRNVSQGNVLPSVRDEDGGYIDLNNDSVLKSAIESAVYTKHV